MDLKDFSLVALALKSALGRAGEILGDVETNGQASMELHRLYANKVADVLSARFGRKFSREQFLREAGVAKSAKAPVSRFGTKRVHCMMAPHDVYIGRGRGGIWGNPFSHKAGTLAEFQVASRDEAVDKHLAWLRTQPELLAKLGELKGKTLGCFCEADERCHGDNLIQLIDELCD